MTFDLVIENAQIVTPTQVVHGSVGVLDERIAAIVSGDCRLQGRQRLDGQGKYLLPGGVDPHVHIRDPGSVHRETFASGSRAAAGGGVTTIIEHPISTPPQYTPALLEARVASFRRQSIVDGAFLGAAGGEFPEEIKRLGEAGIAGFKTFLHEAPAGREEEFRGLCCRDNFELLEALRHIAHTGRLAAAHTEDNDLVRGGIARYWEMGARLPRAHCLSRPPIAEEMAVQRLLLLAREAGARVYLVHISTPQAVRLALQARREGQEVYIETCPHYLYLDESYLDRHGAMAKCNPALRSRELAQELLEYVADGAIDAIGSDHAPYTLAEKTASGDIFDAPAGFPGLETRMPFVLKLVQQGRISIHRAAQLLAGNPARIFGLAQKGEIALGRDADFVLTDPFLEFRLSSARMHTKAKEICAFLNGFPLSGKAAVTILRGRVIFQDGRFPAEPGYGRWIVPQRP